MNILKKLSTSTDTTPGNDQDGAVVPDELRPYYPNIADATPYDGWHVHVLAAIRERAVTEMREAGASRTIPTSVVVTQNDLDTRVQSILESDYADYLARVQHLARLKIAEHAWQIATRDRTASEARRAADTCPICRKCEPVSRGLVQPRPLVEGTESFLGDPAQRSEVLQINSCGVCALIARRDYLDELAAELGADYPSRTVRDAVRAAIGLDRKTAR